jgi:hypothetical protein
MAHSENKRRTTTSATESVVLKQKLATKTSQPDKTQNTKTAAINKPGTKRRVKHISIYVTTVYFPLFPCSTLQLCLNNDTLLASKSRSTIKFAPT